jgi:hypothetical protein
MEHHCCKHLPSSAVTSIDWNRDVISSILNQVLFIDVQINIASCMSYGSNLYINCLSLHYQIHSLNYFISAKLFGTWQFEMVLIVLKTSTRKKVIQ